MSQMENDLISLKDQLLGDSEGSTTSIISKLNTIEDIVDNASGIKSIQRGTTTSATISLSPTVNPNKTLVNVNGSGVTIVDNGDSASFSHAYAYNKDPYIVSLTSTTLTLGNVSGTISYEIVQYY